MAWPIALGLGCIVVLAAGCGDHKRPSKGSATASGSATAAGSTAVASSGSPVSSGTVSTASSAAARLPTSGLACTDDGCLRKVEHVGDYDRATLMLTMGPGVTLENGYSVDTITFFTSGREARATIVVPIGAAPASGFHVVANNHGTMGVDNPCKVAGTILGAGLAGTFGGRGMIGVAVDYPGLGTEGIHPYLVSDSEGRASLDALRATKVFAASKGIALSGRFAVVGLSQGGHATLAAAARHKSYAPELDIRGFAVVGPASAWEEHWRLGAQYDGPFVAVHAMLVYAWANHYGYRGPPLWTDAVSARIDEVMKTTCVFAWPGQPTLADKLGTKMADVFAPKFLEAYRSGNWGEYAAFAGYFRDNRIGPYPQSAPLKVYQGDKDAIVPEFATKQVVESLRAGGVEVDYEVVPGGGHTDVAFGFVSNHELRTDESISWLKGRLDSTR